MTITTNTNNQGHTNHLAAFRTSRSQKQHVLLLYTIKLRSNQSEVSTLLIFTHKWYNIIMGIVNADIPKK